MNKSDSVQTKKTLIIATIAGALVYGVIWSIYTIPFISIMSVVVYCLTGGIAALIVVTISIRTDRFNKPSYPVIKAIAIDFIGAPFSIIAYNFGFLGRFAIHVIGIFLAFVIVHPLIKVIYNIRNKNHLEKEGEIIMNDNNGKQTAASSIGVIAKISWVAVAIGCAIGGQYIADDVAGYRFRIIGLFIGLAVGALVGFLVNLFLMFLAELGQNTAKTAANSGGNQAQTASAADEIQKYKEMLDNGVITYQEFEDLKRNLIQK